MNEPLDRTVHDALDAAASRTVAPPFAAVRRRHFLRRRRRAAGAALSAVAFVAVGLATPGVLGRRAHVAPAVPVPTATPTVEPSTEPTGEPSAEPTVDPSPSRDGVCDIAPRTTDPTPFATGLMSDFSVMFYAEPTRDGDRCVQVGGHPPLSLQGPQEARFGPVGSLRARLYSAIYPDTADDAVEHVIVWGALEPEVARVRFATGTRTYDVTPVRLRETPDRVHVGYLFPRAVGAAWSWRAYDADGREVARS